MAICLVHFICKDNAFVEHYKSTPPSSSHPVVVPRLVSQPRGAIGRGVCCRQGIELISEGQHNVRCDSLVQYIGDGLSGRGATKGTPLSQQIQCLQLQCPPPILEEGVPYADVPYPEVSLHIIMVPLGIAVGETMGEAETEGWRPGSYAEEPVVKCLSVTLPGYRICKVVIVPGEAQRRLQILARPGDSLREIDGAAERGIQLSIDIPLASAATDPAIGEGG